MAANEITLEHMDELLAYLPVLEKPGRGFVKEWAGGVKTSAGDLTVPFPVYEDDVVEFFTLAGEPRWCDYDYDPGRTGELIKNPEVIKKASLELIKTMLTWCVRGERFTDGHWEQVLKKGWVQALLKRLRELRDATA